MPGQGLGIERWASRDGSDVESRVEGIIVGTRTRVVMGFSDEMGEGYIVGEDGGGDLLVCFPSVAAFQGGAFRALVEDARISYEVVLGGSPCRPRTSGGLVRG